ncbi:MAG TPA: YceD family protein [Verrucomicrobiae bacterium]|nr:YceD family protein [Verrucomicrobiae bacterium]
MPLKINLRHLEEHAIRLKGELPVTDLDFGLRDDLMRAEKPLKYDLTVEKLHDAILVAGLLKLTLDCECARCLKPFSREVNLEHWTLHLPLVGDEKVSVDNDCVDLTPFVREDMILEFPQHPLCQPDCAGLKNAGVGKAPKIEDENESRSSAWAELNKLEL